MSCVTPVGVPSVAKDDPVLSSYNLCVERSLKLILYFKLHSPNPIDFEYDPHAYILASGANANAEIIPF